MKHASYNWSLRHRLIGVVISASVLLWIISLGIMAFIAWQQTSRLFDDGLRDGAHLILETRFEIDSKKSFLNAPVVENGRSKLDYQIIVNHQIVRRTSHAPRTAFVAGGIRETDRFLNVSSDGQSWRVFVLHNENPELEVQIAQPFTARLRLLYELTENLVWPALGLLVLLGLVTWIAIQRIVRPLDEAARAISAKSPDDLTPLALAGQPREMQPIIGALNQVFAQLASALEGERRFTADAAHELRTPLAALRMKAQLLQRQYPEHEAAWQSLRDDAGRCTDLVNNLLILARLDHPDRLIREDIALDALIDDLRHSHAMSAKSANIKMVFHNGVGNVRANPNFLRIALDNLIDNAVRYCPPGSRIHVESSQVDRDILITVCDDGPGVTAEHREALVRRFFRVLGSGQPGSGLGLSIVDRVVSLHGGSLHFGTGLEGAGLGVQIKLPIRP